MMLLFGGFAFRSLVLRPAVRKVLTSDERIKTNLTGDRRIVKNLWLGATTLAVTSCLALVLQAMDVFDKSFVQALSPSVLAQTLATGYGPSWILQVGTLVAIVLILLLISRRLRQQPAAEHPICGGSDWLRERRCCLRPPGLDTHWYRRKIFASLCFLTGFICWREVSGSADYFILREPGLQSCQQFPLPRDLPALHYLIRFFTRMAMPSVVLLVLAGLYNTWAHIPGIRALWTTPYGAFA